MRTFQSPDPLDDLDRRDQDALVERVARHLDESAVFFEQVMKVQSALLPVFESRSQQRHGRLQVP